MRPLLIDCDTGIDDGIAIALAHQSGVFDIVAITAVSGNLTADRCSENSRIILDLIGAGDIPVAQGPMRPLVRPYPRDPFSHGDNGLANIVFPPTRRVADKRFAPDLIIEMADRYPGQLEIAALGPLTNLALATIKDPSLPGKVAKVNAIAGAFGFQQFGTSRATGDNPASEWNVYVDPEAAQLVFEAGFNLTAVGLDVATHPQLTLSAQQRATLRAAKTPMSSLVLDVLDFVEKRGFGAYCGLIDSMAIAALIDPGLVEEETIRVIVERKSDLSLGQTIVERRENFAWDGLSQISAVKDAKFGAITDLLVSACIK
jgi:inosine-uridine nucleoside N-ribohydrolase